MASCQSNLICTEKWSDFLMLCQQAVDIREEDNKLPNKRVYNLVFVTISLSKGFGLGFAFAAGLVELPPS